MDVRELGPVIEAMWREGMLYHEIAELFDISCGSVHRLIRERVPHGERAAQEAGRLDDGRSSDERLLGGVRKAARILAEGRAGSSEERRYAQAAIRRSLEARSELTGAADAGSPSERLSPAELHGELARFEAELRAGGLRASTIQAYLLGSSLFVRWLAGDYVPGPRRVGRLPAALGNHASEAEG